ncbi:hypothetical protein H4R99_003554 [Coemansia sp. RSA 1722]|nr:hypothetical protein H4R99_003554 [Coemansia sp. RSA 1722]
MPPRRPRNLRTSAKSSWDDDSADRKEKDNDLATSKELTQPSMDKPNNGQTESSSKAPAQPNPPKVDIDDLRELQRLKRQRQRGLDVATLGKANGSNRFLGKHASSSSSSSSSKSKSSLGTESHTADGTAIDDAHGQSTRSLSNAFTAQTNKLDADKYMMEFIEKEMKRYRGSDDPQASDAQAPDADDLYQVPEHLRIVKQKPLNEGNVAMAAKMLTSIQEVDLGKEAKIRNIRETDRAVSLLAKSSSAARDPALDEISSRISSPAKGKRHADHSDRSSKATDDVVMQRFKKRMRR